MREFLSTLLALHWHSLLGWVWLATGIYLAGRIVWQRRSPAATLAWIMALCLIPPVGLVLYHFVGPQRVKRQKLRRMKSQALLAASNDLEALYARDASPPAWAMQHSALIEHCCGIPLSSCERVDLLDGGAATLDAIVEAVSRSESHIHLEYYIFEPDHAGLKLASALCHKARQGVNVRLLVDGVGSANLLLRQGRALRRMLADAGVELGVFHPTRLYGLLPLVNLRTHRKLVICDGRVGFTGGINVTDEEDDRLFPDSAYRDTHVRLEGAAVRWLQYTFLQDWIYATGRHEFAPHIVPLHAPGPHAVHVATSGPDSEGQAIHHSMVHAISIAQHRILLTTPYFVPTEPAWFALINAARRGVEVRIMVPRHSDSHLVTAAARSYYPSLLEAGVHIFEYQGRMLHAKTLVVDRGYAMVGSANFDNRSLLLNFEIALALYSESLNGQLARMFTRDLARCRPISGEEAAEPWFRQLPVAVARLLSPLL
ncbi:cardiolipin synthase [Brachymonas sp.]|uniref:cardiolipin synthase n=1 Tax=Brachymonas sp. TaxID=1936292 RepID=UPI0035B152D5